MFLVATFSLLLALASLSSGCRREHNYFRPVVLAIGEESKYRAPGIRTLDFGAKVDDSQGSPWDVTILDPKDGDVFEVGRVIPFSLRVRCKDQGNPVPDLSVRLSRNGSVCDEARPTTMKRTGESEYLVSGELRELNRRGDYAVHAVCQDLFWSRTADGQLEDNDMDKSYRSKETRIRVKMR